MYKLIEVISKYLLCMFCIWVGTSNPAMYKTSGCLFVNFNKIFLKIKETMYLDTSYGANGYRSFTQLLKRLHALGWRHQVLLSWVPFLRFVIRWTGLVKTLPFSLGEFLPEHRCDHSGSLFVRTPVYNRVRKPIVHAVDFFGKYIWCLILAKLWAEDTNRKERTKP